jgi:rhomboid family GlyGly-CTERM serine protease
MALLAGAIGAFFFGMGPANPLLFRIGDLENGRWWTLWTSHGVHFSASHLFWDALAVGVLGRCLEGQLGARRTLALLALAAPGVAYGTLCLEPGVVGYGGLSGLACVLAGGLMVTFGRGGQRERQVAWFLGLLLAAKIGWEFINRGEAIFVARVAAPTVVVPWAHALGAMLGAGLVGGTFCLAAMRERFRGGGDGLLSDEACGLKSGHDAVPCAR